MSMGLRGFVEFVEKKIEEEGILYGSEHSYDEIVTDTIDMIWQAYEEWKGEE